MGSEKRGGIDKILFGTGGADLFCGVAPPVFFLKIIFYGSEKIAWVKLGGLGFNCLDIRHAGQLSPPSQLFETRLTWMSGNSLSVT
jgi:hypothetical protein